MVPPQGSAKLVSERQEDFKEQSSNTLPWGLRAHEEEQEMDSVKRHPKEKTPVPQSPSS